ncbi:MAG: FAD-dependent oxidoreductase [Bdellovibrionales bacterium]|nr:FAD-dependent oxidoreductase [Bdellovibrionales bacterium]
MQIYDYIVVGAGLCGLTLARLLEQEHQRVLVVDKGRGRGGRMSTRRWKERELFFDHGLGGFEKVELVEKWLDQFGLRDLVVEREPLSLLGFTSQYFAKAGVSSIGRALSADLEVVNSYKLTDLSVDEEGLYRLQSEDGELHFATNVVLTIPLPQAKALLADSGSESLVKSISQLPDAEYTKVVVLMAEVEKLGPLEGRHGYEVDESFSVINMGYRYPTLAAPAVMLLASGNWAEQNYDESLEQKTIALKTKLESFGIGKVNEMQLHGWRYAFAESTAADHSGLLALDGQGLWLSGEASSGRGAVAALRAAYSACTKLLLTPS